MVWRRTGGVVEWLGLRGGAEEVATGQELPLWHQVDAPTRRRHHLGWAVVAVGAFVVQRTLGVVDDGVMGSLIVAVAVFGGGSLLSERATIRKE
ncbi:hypothetical protein KEM60_00506 [Austwickia sp. TVS 96-490-7B]|uniref:hypothetical protein n=1 Tax=Austwickia sp. TVS 96-490-7B TaxID=2830843 RepID=UPI001C594FF9|nr:hypothetical protein [Austwickia sp. TVS 96-490-7B]MBW3084319.1 hypothetical protein [Austwickia sp. TVS 96-490-7B]